MITLNTEKGLVQIDKLEDITGRPGFLLRIDPKKDGHRLKALLGAYEFPEPVHCGLPCNQAHNKGFLAATDKGAEILLGNVCGKNVFGVDFKVMRNRLIKDMTSKHRREAIERAKHEISMWRARLAALRADGATEFYNLGQALLGSNASVPKEVASAVQNLLRTGRNVVAGSRPATVLERELYEVQNDGRKAPPNFEVQEEYGRLAGLSFFSPEQDLRRLLIDGIEDTLKQVEAIDPDTAGVRHVATVARAIARIPEQFERAHEAISQAKLLFTRQNLAPLRRIIRGRESRVALDQFMERLPE